MAMRILIVGGGIAGLTLAGLLRQRGAAPIIVEKSGGYGGVGYVIGLWPIGGRILKALGLYELFREKSQAFLTYQPCDERGRLLRSFDMTDASAGHGPVLGIRRAELIDLLRLGCEDTELRFGTSIDRLNQDDREVQVQFTDGRTESFDLVVGCDGLRSRTRELLFGEVPLTYLGWTGWAWWLDPSVISPETVIEYWAAGRFLGLYPAKEALCCFCAMPVLRHAPDSVRERAARLRRAFGRLKGPAQAALEQLPAGEEIWHDDFEDLRMPRWSRGRVLLIGDAAAAILPTAGIGASMAMESAAALADELSRADAEDVELAIRLFTRRRRPRVDAVQAVSRRLARLMLLRSPLLTYLRNQLLRRMSEQALVGSFRRLHETPF